MQETHRSSSVDGVPVRHEWQKRLRSDDAKSSK